MFMRLTKGSEMVNSRFGTNRPFVHLIVCWLIYVEAYTWVGIQMISEYLTTWWQERLTKSYR